MRPGKKRMQTHNRFVLVSWWWRANLVQESHFYRAYTHIRTDTSAKMELFSVSGKWWVCWSTDVCSWVHVKKETDVECILRKRVRDKVFNTIIVRTLLWMRIKPYGRSIVEETAFRFIQLEFSAVSAVFPRSTYFWLNKLWSDVHVHRSRRSMRPSRIEYATC